MNDLYGVIGTNVPDFLLQDPQGAEKIAIPLEPGNGNIKRGTVMYRKSNGFYAPAASAQISTSYNLVVIDEDAATGDTVSTYAYAAAAYRAGRFVEGRVKLTADADISEAEKIVLRMQGIVFDVYDGSDGFQNGAFTVTYKPNNGITPAEDDYEVKELNGATHTVLSNSVTGFTAPDTKSFSKWNTKADGTGTDKAAASTLTITGDVTLYAIWA